MTGTNSDNPEITIVTPENNIITSSSPRINKKFTVGDSDSSDSDGSDSDQDISNVTTNNDNDTQLKSSEKPTFLEIRPERSDQQNDQAAKSPSLVRGHSAVAFAEDSLDSRHRQKSTTSLLSPTSGRLSPLSASLHQQGSHSGLHSRNHSFYNLQDAPVYHGSYAHSPSGFFSAAASSAHILGHNHSSHSNRPVYSRNGSYSLTPGHSRTGSSVSRSRSRAHSRSRSRSRNPSNSQSHSRAHSRSRSRNPLNSTRPSYSRNLSYDLSYAHNHNIHNIHHNDYPSNKSTHSNHDSLCPDQLNKVNAAIEQSLNMRPQKSSSSTSTSSSSRSNIDSREPSPHRKSFRHRRSNSAFSTHTPTGCTSTSVGLPFNQYGERKLSYGDLKPLDSDKPRKPNPQSYLERTLFGNGNSGNVSGKNSIHRGTSNALNSSTQSVVVTPTVPMIPTMIK